MRAINLVLNQNNNDMEKTTADIFFLCGNGNHPLGSETLKKLGELLGKSCKFNHINFNKFPEGELDNRIPNHANIKGKTVVLFQSMHSSDLMLEALDLTWALHNQYGAARIIGVFPFVWNRRQDPKMEIDPNDLSGKKAKQDEIQRLKMLVDDFAHRGLTDMIVATPHSKSMQEYCKEYGINFYEINTSPLFDEAIKTFVPEEDLDLVKVYTPDLGSMPRAIALAKILNCSVLFNLKNRIIYNETSIKDSNPEELEGILKNLREKYDFPEIYYCATELVKGKIIVMIEDEVASGSTANNTGQLLRKMEAKSIFLLATHAVLTWGWRNKLFYENPFTKIIMTNSIQRDYEKRTGGHIVDISIAPAIATKMFKLLN